ncbi:MAG: glycosyltransferase [Clostridia bacterium]|nr:glycosyltransferase [Clostridia bacterium]
MKKIVFLIHDLMGGGAEKVLVNMVNNLDKEKYDVTVAALFDEGVYKDSLAPHIKYKYFMKNSFNGNKYIFRCFSPEFWYQKVFGKEEFDIVVSYLEGTCARIASGAKKAKKIAWIHSRQSEEKYAECFKNKAEADRIYSSFDKVVFVAQSLKDYFTELCPTLKNGEVLYNVNETDNIISLSKEDVEENYLFSDGVPVISFLGKITQNKGVSRLVNIHARLKEENIPHRFILLGEGEEKENAQKALESKGAADDFIFLGFQSNPYKYVAKSQAFVCASYSEGFSTATTEALVLGVPVVVTDCSGMKEMLGNNEYGIITENDEDALYEGIKKILTDKELLAHYKQKAQEHGKDFSKQERMKEIEKFFEKI